MKKVNAHIYVISILVLVIGAACARNPVEMEASVNRLMPVVQSVLFDEEYETQPSAEEVMEQVYHAQPALREVFEGLPIRIWHDDELVVVLIASPDGYCWFEDSSETGYVDRPCYKENPPVRAEFTLIPRSETEKSDILIINYN